MSKWVKTDTLLFSLENIRSSGMGKRLSLDTLKEQIINNSEEIIRCKECKWQSVITDKEEGTSYYMCGVWANATDEDVFCSYGVRKTNTTAEEKTTPIRDYMVHGEREGK